MKMLTKINNKLSGTFSPLYLSVENESHLHQTPPDAETHFKVVMVSSAFSGQLPVKRHQSVYRALCTEIKDIHALALHLYTLSEWNQKQNQQQTVPASPACAHKNQ